MKTLWFSLIFVGFLSFIDAQPTSTKFGEVEEQYIRMQQYEPDSNAEALYLYDYGSARMEISSRDVSMTYEFHQRIKILSESMVDMADYELVYNTKGDNVSKIEGFTYNVDEQGNIETYKLTNKEIYEEKLEGDYRKISFRLPQVKAGSVIEVSYRLLTDDIYNLRSWVFQQPNIPVLYSEYETMVPDWFVFVPVMNGYLGLTDTKSQSFTRNVPYSTLSRYGSVSVQHSMQGGTVAIEGKKVSYIMKDIPAFIAEPYLTNVNDYLSTLDFQLSMIKMPGSVPKPYMSDWSQLSKELLEYDSFGGMLTKSSKIKKILNEIEFLGDTDREKAQVIFDFVRNRIKWNKSYSFVASSQLSEVMDEGIAGSGDINLLLIAMLKEAGIDTYPLLISTRSHGKMQEVYPVVSQFNHLIALAKIDSVWVPIDAIDDQVVLGMLPFNDLNHKGFLVDEVQPQWVDLASEFSYNREASFMLGVVDASVLSGTFNYKARGYTAVELNHELKDMDSSGVVFAHEYFFDEYTDVKLDKVKILDDDANELVSVSCDITTTDYIDNIGEYTYIQPMMNYGWEENPFKLDERKYPVDFAVPMEWTNRVTFLIPEGMVVDEMPKPAKILLPDNDGVFLYNYNQMDHMIQILSTVKINRSVFDPGRYKAIRDFFDFIVKKHAEQIVLKPKS